MEPETNDARVQIVKPLGNGGETAWLLVAMFLVLTVWGGAILLHQRTGEVQTLGPHQISGFSDLNPAEQGIFSDLYSAGFEIDAMHDESGLWPTVAELEADFVSPFVRDTSWDKRGRPVWKMSTTRTAGSGHGAAYLGIPCGDVPCGAFALLVAHVHEDGMDHAPGSEDHEASPFTIWRHDRPGRSLPSDPDGPGMVRTGWKEVVPHLGKTEKQRITSGGRS